jgi:hypothetical protein
MALILIKRTAFRGFTVSDFNSQRDEFMRDMTAWVREGNIKYRENVVEGLENAVSAFRDCRGDEISGSSSYASPHKLTPPSASKSLQLELLKQRFCKAVSPGARANYFSLLQSSYEGVHLL